MSEPELADLGDEWAWGYDFDEDGDCTMAPVESREVAEMMAAVWRSDAKVMRRRVSHWAVVEGERGAPVGQQQRIRP